MGIYDINVTTNRGECKNLGDYKGKVMLIANTASKCGFTDQYEGLEALNQKYKGKGLCVMGFPSDDFAHQEPDDDETIAQNCKLNFGVSFELFKKGSVRGENAVELFKFLTAKQGFKGFDEAHPLSAKLTKALSENFPEILEGDGVKWNFTKFVVDKNGEVVARFEPTAPMSEVEECVKSLLISEFEFAPFIKKMISVDYGIEGLEVYREHTSSGTLYFVKAHREIAYPRHAHKSQFTSVLAGSCTLDMNGEVKCYKAGDTYIIPEGSSHQITLHAGYAEMDYVDDPLDGES